MKTLLLDQSAWDLVLDASGNIACAADPYALAQDAASSIKTFHGEPYYDTARGVHYFQKILGKAPNLQLMKAEFNKAALLVPGVVASQCFFSGIKGRKLTGQVQITDNAGNTIAVPI